MRQLDSITDSMDMNLSKPQEVVKDREAWCGSPQARKESDTTQRLSNNEGVLKESWCVHSWLVHFMNVQLGLVGTQLTEAA